MNTSLTRTAPAKINLTLRVGATRPDGFHEIESLVALVEFGDTLTVTTAEPGRYALQCDAPGVPADGSNLVLAAARALVGVVGGQRGLDIELIKAVPPQAGLGGGSSDAATMLMILNELWQAGLSTDELARLGATIGSDVPLFFYGPICVMRGRGEVVERVTNGPRGHVVLVLPMQGTSTPDVYRAWDRFPTPQQRPDVAALLAAGSADELMELAFNDLELAAFDVNPGLAELARQVAEVGGQAVRLSGSGSALYRVFDDYASAETFAQRVGDALAVRTILTQLLV